MAYIKTSVTKGLQYACVLSGIGYMVFGFPGMFAGAVIGIGGAVSKQYSGSC